MHTQGGSSVGAVPCAAVATTSQQCPYVSDVRVYGIHRTKGDGAWEWRPHPPPICSSCCLRCALGRLSVYSPISDSAITTRQSSRHRGAGACARRMAQVPLPADVWHEIDHRFRRWS